MSTLFKQSDFTGGLFAQFDASKSPDNAYPLLIDARARTGVVSPTRKHVKLSYPPGKKQGIYVAGQYIILIVEGIAYYADITLDDILFLPISGWTTMSTTVERFSADIVPVTTSFYNREDVTAEEQTLVFNSTIAAFPQSLFVFDGANQPQAILPDGTARVLQTYADWSKDHPEYVPIGSLPAVVANKLFLATADRRRILHSVSGRVSDFVVNLDPTGDKGGDAETVATAVSYNSITALRALSSGHVMVATLYGTFVLELDYTNTIFGEPYLRPIGPLFPSGALNEISIVDILLNGAQDTAFITQSGIHSFNAVAQTQRESNNFSLSALVRGLLVNPQADTCAALFDDYAFFAVNTIHGYGVLVFDTTIGQFQSLDLSFGRVKQFATTRLSGRERMFYITYDDQVYEAFSSEEKNAARIYLGDWTPDMAGQEAVVDGISAVFTNVRTDGQAKFSVFADRKFHVSEVEEVTAPGFSVNTPIPIPYISQDQVVETGFSLKNVARGWRIGALLEWNFDGDLSDVSLSGSIKSGENVKLDIREEGGKEELVFIADSGLDEDELSPGGNYGATEIVAVTVVAGEWYAFHGRGDQILQNGSTTVLLGMFKAAMNRVVIKGANGDPIDFSLRSAENYMSVMSKLTSLGHSILHGGDIAYPEGRELDIELALLPVKLPLFATLGEADIITGDGVYCYAALGIPRYYYHDFEFVSVFFFNSDPAEADGVSATSKQADALRLWIAQSDKPFKIVVCHHPPYTNDIDYTPGRTDLQWINGSLGIKAVISGHAHKMERFVVNDFPYFVCGVGGHSLTEFAAVEATTPSYQNNDTFGYLHIRADALACYIDFCDTDGLVLDTYALYA